MHVEIISDDDERFVEIVREVIDASLKRDPPGSLRVIRIDNWFGGRWRGFAGMMLGALGGRRKRLVTWYVELAATRDWKPTVANGIAISEFLRLANMQAAAPDRKLPASL